MVKKSKDRRAHHSVRESSLFGPSGIISRRFTLGETGNPLKHIFIIQEDQTLRPRLLSQL